MKKSLWICTLICAGYLSCNEQHRGVLYGAAEISQIFTSAEIEDLDKIINFVDSIALEHSNSANIDDIYHDFFDSLVIIMQTTGYDDICIDEKVRDQFFATIKSSGTFDHIWISENPRSIRTRDTTINNPTFYFCLDINHLGKYVELLELIKEKDSIFITPYEMITTLGGMAPTLMGTIYNNKILNFEKGTHRLWGAIYYLSLERSVEARLKDYLNQKR